MATNPSIADLAAVSARLGADPMLIQGPGGNTSIKFEGRLWVKASGRWLAHACEQPIFVPLRLDQVRARIAAGAAEDLQPCVVAEEAGDGLRPSIETALHALMDHPVVVHAHAVNSMTASILRDGEAFVDARLAGVARWRWIPYRRPGAPLAEAVRTLTEGRPCDVLILQNHGVVVGADTPEAAARLLQAVEAALRLPAWAPGPIDLPPLRALETPAFEACEELSDIAFDARRLAILTGGSIAPDQVALLGGAIPVAGPGEDIDGRFGRASFVAIPGTGVLGRKDRSPAADLMLRALVEVARRVPDGAETTALPAEAVRELQGWDAEHYRQQLNRDRRHV